MTIYASFLGLAYKEIKRCIEKTIKISKNSKNSKILKNQTISSINDFLYYVVLKNKVKKMVYDGTLFELVEKFEKK